MSKGRGVFNRELREKQTNRRWTQINADEEMNREFTRIKGLAAKACRKDLNHEMHHSEKAMPGDFGLLSASICSLPARRLVHLRLVCVSTVPILPSVDLICSQTFIRVHSCAFAVLRYEASGLKVDLGSVCDPPKAEVINNLLGLWQRTSGNR
jgi:hypothetical protein